MRPGPRVTRPGSTNGTLVPERTYRAETGPVVLVRSPGRIPRRVPLRVHSDTNDSSRTSSKKSTSVVDGTPAEPRVDLTVVPTGAPCPGYRTLVLPVSLLRDTPTASDPRPGVVDVSTLRGPEQVILVPLRRWDDGCTGEVPGGIGEILGRTSGKRGSGSGVRQVEETSPRDRLGPSSSLSRRPPVVRGTQTLREEFGSKVVHRVKYDRADRVDDVRPVPSGRLLHGV